MKMFKTKTGAGISTNSEPAEVKIVPDDKGMISTNNIEAVMRRRAADAEAAKIEAEKKAAQNEKA